MFKENKDLYPTPDWLISKMKSKVDWKKVSTILEPSAGLGHIVNDLNKDRYRNYDVSAIEIDKNCITELLKQNIKVIDTDFLQYNGLEQFDLIIANFPFSDGDKHLHKALDVMFSGQIVCLLNAETIKNPFSNSRKSLIQKLNNLNAKIEFIKDAFIDAERKTSVETALIYIEKYNDVEKSLFDNMEDKELESFEDIKDNNEIATRDNIKNIVLRYEDDKQLVTNQVIEFYKNYNKVSKYLDLRIANLSYDEEKNERYRYDGKTLTEIMKHKLNQFIRNLKRNYWLEALKLDEVKSKITSQKRRELSNELNKYGNMDFNERNIKLFIENLALNYPVMIDEGISYVFDKFTEYALRDGRYAYNECKKNIHYFNGWKTNEAFKVNKKVILPFSIGSYLSSDKEDFLDDIDLIFSYFDNEFKINDEYLIPDKYAPYGKKRKTKSTALIVKYEIAQNNTKNIKTRYFTLNFYQKGTVHFIFNDLELLRKFNIYVAKKRGWLPSNYGNTKEQEFEGFESKKEYKQIGKELAINTKKVLMLNK